MQRINDRNISSREKPQEINRQSKQVMGMGNIGTDKIKEFCKRRRNRRIPVALGKGMSLLPAIDDSPENESVEDTISNGIVGSSHRCFG